MVAPSAVWRVSTGVTRVLGSRVLAAVGTITGCSRVAAVATAMGTAAPAAAPAGATVATPRETASSSDSFSASVPLPALHEKLVSRQASLFQPGMSHFEHDTQLFDVP